MTMTTELLAPTAAVVPAADPGVGPGALPDEGSGISVVIPALNERDSIAGTVERVRAVLGQAGLEPFEVVVVDDGSKDGTGELARQAGARVLRHAHNVGYGRSLKDGITAARYDTIVITDADGSYPIEDIPALVARYREGFDMVVGARTGKHYRESVIKQPLRIILKRIVEFTANRKIPDINSGLRVFSRATAMQFFNHLSDMFSFTTSMTLAYMMNAKFVHYQNIDYHERVGRSKVRLFRDSVRTLQYIVEAATYYNPLKIFFFFGMICLGLAAASIIFGIVLQLVSAFLLGVGAILLGIMVFAMGLLAVLLKQIMDRA
jgi:glycosyltransferase involved in cell wall biosynthesis